jgi:hypothetical protein
MYYSFPGEHEGFRRSAGSEGSSWEAGLAQTLSGDVYRNLIKPLKKQFGSEIFDGSSGGAKIQREPRMKSIARRSRNKRREEKPQMKH